MTMLLLLACAAQKEPAPGDAPPDDTDVPVSDGDGDGFEDDDCDDADAAVFPGATETLGDDVDADCDGDPDGTGVVGALDTLVGPKHGLAVAANTDDVYLHVQLDRWEGEDGVAQVTVAWTGVWDDRDQTFARHYWTGWPEAVGTPQAVWTAKPDFHVDDARVAWANAYVQDGERNVQGLMLPHATGQARGTRVVSSVDDHFEDVDLLDLGDGTFMVAGCDPVMGELVMMHGTAAEFSDVSVPYDYEYAFGAETCSVAALTGALIVSDPEFAYFDLYSYSDDDGLAYQLSLPGYRGYDLDTLVVDGRQWTADAEGEAGLRLVTPDGEAWWTGADVRELDLAASIGGAVVVALLDANGAPWLVWDDGAAGASLAGTFPHADDIGVTWTPAGDVLVAISEADTVSWARWRLPG